MSEAKHILFVCIENSCRSQMAEAFVHCYGDSAVRAYSAGSKASGQVNPKAITSMAELGYDLRQHSSKTLADVPDIEYDFAVTMGCGDACPMVRAKQRIDWMIPDPKNMAPAAFNVVRDLIANQVKQLLSNLSGSTPINSL